jgi:DnaJ-domain-containing protein 1
MPPFLIALIIVVGGLWLIRKSAKLPAQARPAFTQKLAGIAVMAFAVVLLLRGELNAAMGLGVFGMGLYGKSALFPNGMGFKPQAGPQASPPQRQSSGMSRDEALKVLGLSDGADSETVRQTHKRLLKDFHPDKGGSDYLAAKINQAKDVLLGN